MKHWTPEEKQTVADLLRNRLTASQIAAKFGRSKSAVIGVVNRDEALRAVGFQHDKLYYRGAVSIQHGGVR